MFDRLLFALDDSPGGEVATLFTAALARRTGASVHVLHVNEQLVGGNGVALRSRQEATDLVSLAVRQLADAGVRAGGSVCVAPYRRVPQRIVTTALRAISRRHRHGVYAEPPVGQAVLGTCSGAHDAPGTALPVLTAPSAAEAELAGERGRLDGRPGPSRRLPAQLRFGKHPLPAETGTFSPTGARSDGATCMGGDVQRTPHSGPRQ